MGVAAVAGRPPDLFARLRDARIHHLPVERHFGGRERSEKLVATPGIHAEAQRQLAVGGKVVGFGRCVLRRFGRSDRDVAAVPERAPPGDVRRALRLLVVDVPAISVEHFVRAAQPFRRVLARVIASDRSEEERMGRCIGRQQAYNSKVALLLLYACCLSPSLLLLYACCLPHDLPRHATKCPIRKQIGLAEIARRLIEVVHLHQISDRLVAVHVAPTTRHETVGADGEFLFTQHLPERTALAESIAELVLADTELLRSAGIETPVDHLCLNVRRALHVAHRNRIRPLLDAVPQRHRLSAALPRRLELAAFHRKLLTVRARVDGRFRLVVDRAGLDVTSALVPRIGVLQHGVQRAGDVQPRGRAHLAIAEYHDALLVFGRRIEHDRRRGVCQHA